MILVLFFGSEEIKKAVEWKALSMRFFKAYCGEILLWCGYDEVRPQSGRMEMRNPEFILAFFAEMKQNGMLGACAYEQLAMYLCEIFNFTQLPSSISFRLKMLGLGSDYTVAIQRFMAEIRKINKYK